MLLISIERQKKAKQRELQRIKYIKSIDYTGNKFAEEVSKILIDFSKDMIKYYDKSINEKKRYLKT
jgi:hypothetical protein